MIRKQVKGEVLEKLPTTASLPLKKEVLFTPVFQFHGKVQREQASLKYQLKPTLQYNPPYARFAPHSILDKPLEIKTEIQLMPGVEKCRIEKHKDWGTSITRNSDQKYTLIAKYKGELKPALLDSDLVVIPISADGKDLPGKKLNIRGELSSDIVAIPDRIHFGRVEAGKSAEEIVELKSLTNWGFEISSIECNQSQLNTSIVEDGKYLVVKTNKDFNAEISQNIQLHLKCSDGRVCILSIPVACIR